METRELFPRFARAILWVGLWLVAAPHLLLAQPYSLDENGNGTLGSPLAGGPSPMPYQLATDPTGGITSSPVLVYNLEAWVVSGDVALMDAQGNIADLLRFYTPSGGQSSELILYGRADNTNHALADVGIPFPVYPVRLSAVSPTTVWTPTTANQPGFPAGPIPVYDFFQYKINLVSLRSPQSQVALSGTNLIWTLSKGTPNAQFRVLTSPNASMPAQMWTWIGSSNLDANGGCTLSFPVLPQQPQCFYRFSFF